MEEHQTYKHVTYMVCILPGISSKFCNVYIITYILSLTLHSYLYVDFLEGSLARTPNKHYGITAITATFLTKR